MDIANEIISDSSLKEVLELTSKRDVHGLEIHGRITDERNVELLQQPLSLERKSNSIKIAFEWVATNYAESAEKYITLDAKGKERKLKLYESELKLKFIDVDVFRQAALHYKKFGYYCPYDRMDMNGDLIMPDQHADYWDTQLYRRKFGMTAWAGIDEDGNRRLVHITGKHYGFINFAPIVRVVDDEDAVSNEKEFIEDSEDELNAILSLEEMLEGLNIKTAQTASKKIDFPAFFDGQYHLIVAKQFARLLGQNFFFGKARRKGCSYYNAWDLFDDIDLNPAMTVILAASDKKYLIHGKGLMKMLYTFADFIYQQTAFAKDRLVNNKEHIKFGFWSNEGGTKTERGFLSEALAVSAANNPDVTIGKDAFQLAYEELGKFRNFKESYEVTTSTTEAGTKKTGHICGWGTGGTDEANWEDFEDVCYNPESYDSLVCNNVWDQGALGTACIYFYPHVQALEGCMDYNGNTDYKKAWEAYFVKKKLKRETTSDQNAFEKWCGQRANCPAEAFAKSATNIFDREILRYQIQRVRTEPAIKYLARHGKYMPTAGGIRLITNDEIELHGGKVHPPLTEFPLKKETDRTGCIVEWFSPYRDKTTGKVPDGLYVAWQDPYAHDKDIKNLSIRDSIGSTWIFENVNKFTSSGGYLPVACYNGRPEFMDTYNEQVMYMLEAYNAKLMFENDRGDTKRYMQMKKRLHYLFEEPEMQFVKELYSKTGRGFGMHITGPRIGKGAVYLRDMLGTVIGKFPDGSAKLAYHNIFDLGFLNELLRWNTTGNFDRVSAWIVGMYILKEIEHKEIEPEPAVNSNSFFNRPFF